MFDQDAMEELLTALQKGGWAGDLNALNSLFRRVSSGGDIRMFRELLTTYKHNAALPEVWQQAMDRFERYAVQYSEARLATSIYPSPQITFSSPREPGLPANVILDVEDYSNSAMDNVWGEAKMRIRFFSGKGYAGDETLVWTPKRKG
jgi:hypothetical protein